MRWQALTVLFCALVSAATSVETVESEKLEKALVDFLTLDYLSVAQTLWTAIETHADRRTVIARINDEHKRFFSSDFGETASLRHAYYVPDGDAREYYNLHNTITNLERLNSIFQLANDVSQSLILQNGPATENAIARFERDIFVESVKLSNSIFENVSEARFWNKKKSSIEVCTAGTSVEPIESEFHLVYNYYKDIRSALLKGYILTEFTLMLSSVKNLGNQNQTNYQQKYRNESLAKRDEFDSRSEYIQRNIKNLLKIANRDTWNCDSRPWWNSQNYDQVTNFLQGYVDHELNFNTEDSCKSTCADYTKTKNVQCLSNTVCGATQIQHRHLSVCKGDVRDCVDLGDSDAFVCHVTDAMRRYDFMRYNDGQIVGLTPSQGSKRCEFESKAKTWRRWFVKCSSCFCLCDDPSNSERHFSLHEVVSDIQRNKVVTGVHIVKSNGVFQLAISQRTLLPFGQTDGSEENTWKLPDRQFKVNDSTAVDGLDYFTLTYDNRSVNLDELIFPRGKIVTGIRFNHHKGHIVLQIRATDFNYFSGKLLNLHYTPWVTNDAGGQTEIEPPSRKNPLVYGNGLNGPVQNKANQYVTFRPSDFGTDVSQLTVPVIETMKLESKNPVILAGVALTLKTQQGSGGIIAPKLITYDFPIADNFAH